MHLRAFLTALQFLTILPVRFNASIDDKTLQYSLLYYPVVGLVIFAVMALIMLGVGSVLLGYDPLLDAWQYSDALIDMAPPLDTGALLILSAVALVSWVALTGALHLDGFADSVDALMAGHKVYVPEGDQAALQKKRETILTIMKDPNAGPMAVIALIILLLFKFSLITGLLVESLQSPVYLLLVLVSLVLARMLMVVVLLETPYAKAEGLGVWLQAAPKKIVYGCYAALLLVMTLLLGHWLLVVLLVMAIVAFMLRQFSVRSVGGVTGDLLGMQLELYEVLGLFIGLAVLRLWG